MKKSILLSLAGLSMCATTTSLVACKTPQVVEMREGEKGCGCAKESSCGCNKEECSCKDCASHK